MDENPSPAADGREQLQLPLERTYLACERTLQAWVRTSASPITFGFVLFKFCDPLNVIDDPGRVRNRILTARGFGILMIFAGLMGLVLATVQYRQAVAWLKPRYSRARLPVALLIAILVVVSACSRSTKPSSGTSESGHKKKSSGTSPELRN